MRLLTNLGSMSFSEICSPQNPNSSKTLTMFPSILSFLALCASNRTGLFKSFSSQNSLKLPIVVLNVYMLMVL